LKKIAVKLKKNKAQNAEQALLAGVQAVLAPCVKPESTLLLALSGGLDSVVLLHLLANIKNDFPFNLYALHVHHGISQNANTWATFCKQQCDLLNVALEIKHVCVDGAGLGIEAEARKLRYEALFNFKLNDNSPDFIVTAHHLDDQSETLLLQLFRGAGVKGLASMAAVDSERRLLRPLLNSTRASLLDYAQVHNLNWCEDESNRNHDFNRNFVRHEVLPLLSSRYSAINTVLARAASHIAEASNLIDTLASLDAANLLFENSLCLVGLGQIEDVARIKNVLRWWFASNGLLMPNASQIDEVVRQLLHAKPDAAIGIKLQHLTLKRYKQRAYLVKSQLKVPFDIIWKGEETLILPDGNVLIFKKKIGSGLAMNLITEDLSVSNHNYPKSFKTSALRPTKSWKRLMQEIDMPPWRRKELPLLYLSGKLVYVPNIGATYTLNAKQDEIGLVVRWECGRASGAFAK